MLWHFEYTWHQILIRVLCCFFTFMNWKNVSLNCSLQKNLVTDITFEWFVRIVDRSSVFWQIALLRRTLVTNVTLNGFIKSKIVISLLEETSGITWGPYLYSKWEVHSDLVQEIVFNKNHFIVSSRVGNLLKGKWLVPT